MRVLLLNPPYFPGYSRSQRSPAVTKGGSMYYPYWLASATGVLQEDGFEVDLVDAPADRITREGVLKWIGNFKPQLVVLDTSTPSINSDIDLAKEIKEQNQDISLGLVGTHPSIESTSIMDKNPHIDWIAREEYDYSVRELARALKENKDFGQIKGISYRRGVNVYHNAKVKLIENMDRLPFISKVYKKHLNIKHYYFIPSVHPMVMLITARGCPFNCFFCLYPQVMHGHKYRFHSPEYVTDEMSYVLKELPEIREIVFDDDTFTANIPRVHSICELMLKKKIKIPWFANLRVDVDLNTVKLMKEAGLRSCAVGYESGNQQLLNDMKKGIRLEQSYRFAERARKLGIIVHGCFMVGFPSETRDTMEQTFQFAQRLKCDSAQFYPVFLYPGTEAYRWAKERGYLATDSYNEWLLKNGEHRCTYNLPGLSASEMTQFCAKAYFRYHLNWRFVLRKLLNLFTDPLEFERTLYYGSRFLLYLLRKLTFHL